MTRNSGAEHLHLFYLRRVVAFLICERSMQFSSVRLMKIECSNDTNDGLDRLS